ncbi:MAG: hybrid sensor histidine kinase/response regulator [Cyanobacteria bacterium QH_8_48_120]|jgi:signal transduction histidine kinase|nr:MAG: hybrid sensor histidine kinase/response regulator [Cyanobacteria bacterium QH_1_48_107]PSO53100.1 MAG: hybrid sensor histidine kinase/response regulator [Cyanobacteria bacterium QH_10_48_56]PSO63950.1 MAG: hybrid sensor histidine kinase/response regulator [Cyanobacteria bacterium QH_7_48_89]PSO65829.1 MAG: hybrid sensor histidine kinase/response regulator [Cyanobacteria bacterium QH_6_48_35]PSO68253.1 MAG: hybrid sensor histidine kinase/response regulator [Cyanobacteria bacterium QS_1_4
MSQSLTDRILVVDDSPDNLLLVQNILEEEEYEVVLAEDGFTALDKLEQSLPTLILLDVMMPEMDGFEVTKRIRGKEDLPFIPILLITAYDQPSVVQGLDSGADEFIRKPVEVDELLARVRSLLRLKHSIDERNEMERQRADFVSRLTHDLRTPLVAADRMLSLFQQGALGELSDPMQEAIESMARSNRNLLDMVNTLLEVYRYEAGRKTLSFSTVDLRELAEEVVQELQPLATEQGLSLHSDWEEQAKTQVEGDRLELRRVLTNLVGNAIKFTEQGSVYLRLKTTKPDESGTGWIMVEVQDTGQGIPPEEQQALFERFRQGGHKRSGSGLGLHLSRRILEVHQGTIEVQSQVGEGSSFIVKLPAKNN